jgi:hypothetical protein
MRKSATSRNPPQQAKVRAVSWVSSVWALMSAPIKHSIIAWEIHRILMC